jgi:hypothetical protein
MTRPSPPPRPRLQPIRLSARHPLDHTPNASRRRPLPAHSGHQRARIAQGQPACHGGLPLYVVEEAARGLCTELQEAARAIIDDVELPADVLVELPADVLVEVKFMDGKPDTTYGGRPYQPLRTHQLGLTLMLSMNQPFKVRSVAGMLPGITTHRDNDQSFIVVDPTHPDVAPLYLHITDLQPEPTDDARQRIRACRRRSAGSPPRSERPVAGPEATWRPSGSSAP